MPKFKVEIDTTNCNHKSGTAKATGKPYSFYEQSAYVFENPDDRYPRKIEISHNDLNDALPVGKYILDLDPAVYFDRFGNPAIDMRNAKFIPDTQVAK